jgi:MFS family permease
VFSLKGIWDGAISGLRYLRTDKLQWALFVLIFPATLVGSGLNALQTPLAKAAVGISDFEFGVFQGVWGSGFLIASLLLGWFGAKQRRSSIMLVGFFLAFLSTGAMGFSRTLNTLLLTGFLVGFANTLYYVGTTTILMENTPEGVIGRVLSTRQFAISSIRVISPLIFGAFADTFGIRGAVISMASLGLVGTALAILANPVIWRFESAILPSATIIRFWETTTGTVHPGLDSTQQRRLSFGLLAIVVITLITLLSRAPLVVAFSILTVATLWAIGRAVRGLGLKP